ncbi:MAG: secretin and TonB N-terminal domain-containing protein [Candidatus Omnitrophica bacterium]|nr:secretin and TonB N-terminal domain-containing protein [Candidatus Omnitrophota bacterium]
MNIKKTVVLLCIVLLSIVSPGFSAQLGKAGFADNTTLDPLMGDGASRVSLDFENAALKDILKALSRQTGANFVASDIIEGKVITVFLNDVSIEEALYSILDANNLTYERQEGNVYLIKPAGGKTVRTVTRVYRFNYIQVYDFTLKGEGEGFATPTGGTTSSSSSQTTNALQSSDQSKSSSTPTVPGGAAKSIVDILKTLLSENGTITADRRTNSLIITDIMSSFSAVEKTIKELDIEPIQIMIQAEIIETTTDAIKRIGVEYGTATQTAKVTWGKNADDEGARLQVPVGYPLPEHFIKRTFDESLLANKALFSYGTLSADDTDIVLKLFATDSDTKLLSRPRIMTVNNMPAVIRVAANTAIGLDSTIIGQGNETIEKAERVETGIVLKVIPNVNGKGEIFLYVEPSIARATASEFFTTQFMDPQTRSASSTVMVRSGDTVVIGGLIQKNDSRTVRKVPWLGDIPILGEAFKSRFKQGTDTELLIFITPRTIERRDGDIIIPKELTERDQMMEQTLQKYRNNKKADTSKEEKAVGTALKKYSKKDSPHDTPRR